MTHTPRAPEHYKSLIPSDLGIVHATVEVQPCAEAPALHKQVA